MKREKHRYGRSFGGGSKSSRGDEEQQKCSGSSIHRDKKGATPFGASRTSGRTSRSSIARPYVMAIKTDNTQRPLPFLSSRWMCDGEGGHPQLQLRWCWFLSAVHDECTEDAWHSAQHKLYSRGLCRWADDRPFAVEVVARSLPLTFGHPLLHAPHHPDSRSTLPFGKRRTPPSFPIVSHTSPRSNGLCQVRIQRLTKHEITKRPT